jgi:hypothetical protein
MNDLDRDGSLANDDDAAIDATLQPTDENKGLPEMPT